MIEALHLQELLHVVAQAFLYPTIIVLIILIIFLIWVIGSVIVEGIVERRHFKVALPELLAEIEDKPYADLPDVVAKSGLLAKQKRMVDTVIAYGYLPDEAREALARQQLSDQEAAYNRVASRTDMVARISPMIGLMGTLIPLGPGIVALGQGQTELLASSIEVAFDTTVTGLLIAIVALVISRFRKRWYSTYLDTLEAIVSSILEKAHNCCEAGEDIGDSKRAAAFLSSIGAEVPEQIARRTAADTTQEEA